MVYNSNIQIQPLIIIALIIAVIIGGIILFFVIKPYVIKYDTTALFTGGLGSGKSLESVKQSIICLRKNRMFKYGIGNFKKWIINIFRKANRKPKTLRFWKGINKPYFVKRPLEYAKKPKLYSNIPVKFKPHLWSFRSEWAVPLEIDHLLLFKEIDEYSVVLIDEFPQFLSQFDWDVELAQNNINEFITFFRHYIGGNLIMNAQSEDEIECHVRRKLNIATWCFDFHVWPFPFLPLFYTNRMCDFMMSDNVQTMNTTYVEENTKLHFGFFPGRFLGIFPGKAYDTRCYKLRYRKVDILVPNPAHWERLTTNRILKIRPYISPLDDNTTKEQVKQMEKKADELKKSKEEKFTVKKVKENEN